MEAWRLDDGGSFSWSAGAGDRLRRTATALVLDAGTLLVDALDVPGLDDALAPLPPVLGVTHLLDRHRRDTDALAARLGVAVLAPAVLAGRGDPLAVAGVEERVILAAPGWNESALWLPDRRLLVCADALGTTLLWTPRPGDRLGVHPLLRLRPPTAALAGLEPAVVAVGHGAPVTDGAAEALAGALAGARRGIPAVVGRAVADTARAAARRVGARR